MANTTLRVLKLESVQAAGSQLSIRYDCGKHRFYISYWYDFDLESLDGIYGRDFMENVYTHCAAFSLFHLCSLKPDLLDLGAYSRWHTAEFERVREIMWRGLTGEWRYENDLQQINAPIFASKPSPPTDPVGIEPLTPPATLAFFGGGKDSLVVHDLLSKAGIPFSTVTFSHTLFGRSAIQHDMCEKVLKVLHSETYQQHHKLSMLGDFLDSPVLESTGKKLGIKNSHILDDLTGALFAALPITLYYRYTSIAIGNERSANVGNLVWERTGEEINHQWEKSKESEIIFCKYVQKALISNVQYFSVLQPIYDAVIFSVAASHLEAASFTQSCNLIKPWCKRCPKCCYVWLMFMAFFPQNIVDEMFHGANLLDFPENEIHFVELLGLGSKRPFECVGESDEA